jgi:hypothetical protein
VEQVVHSWAAMADIHSLVGVAVANTALMEAVALAGLVVEAGRTIARTGSAVLGVVLVEHLAVGGNRSVHSPEVAGWERGKIGGCPQVSRID